MDPDGWQRAKTLIDAALQRPPEERRRFLAAACDDPILRQEVEALLESYQMSTGSAATGSGHEGSGSTGSESADPDPGNAAEFEFQTGCHLGHYRLVEPLGKGGGGEVHRARDTRLQRDVAIKILAADGTADAARRVREARAVAQLNHRGIVAIYDIFEIGDAGGRACIVMEYVAGHSLADVLREGRVGLPDVIDLGLQMADAVAHAHAAGIVHCDLKPGNVKRATDGLIKVLDFGLARRADDSRERSAAAVTGLTAASLRGLPLGTPGYISPEQLLGLPIDCRTDVYSLGVMLFELAAGHRPFDASDLMSTAIAVLSSPLPDLPPDVPRRLRAIIRKSLSRHADDRYPSAAELRDALASLRSSSWRHLLASTFRRSPISKRIVPVLALIAASVPVLVGAQEQVDGNINARIRQDETVRFSLSACSSMTLRCAAANGRASRGRRECPSF